MRTIREIREEVGMKQLELARRIRANPVTVYNWERGAYDPSAKMLRRVALELGVSMDDIALPSDTKNRHSDESE